jgi:hemolysin activation/secretion protein
MTAFPSVRWRAAAGLLLLANLLSRVPADAQQTPAGALSGSRLIDNGRLDQVPPAAVPTSQMTVPQMPIGGAVPTAPAALAARQFLLTELVVDGARSVPAEAIAATWRARQGQRVSVADIYAIAKAIGEVYARSDIALYSVYVPRQPFDGTPVHIRVVEGFVAAVSIEGDTEGADLDLLKRYAARIVADRPLRRTTLERYILLMNEIAGMKVGSKFEVMTPPPGDSVLADIVPGAVRLRLGIARKPIDYGFGFNNQGASVLSRVQVDANVVANSVFREGDRTQLVFGAPITIDRYQYYGLSHVEPIGSDGATLTASLGDLITHPKRLLIGGDAVIASLQGSYPIILRTREALNVNASFDALDSNNAVLGTTLSDERTRTLRLGAAYAVQDKSGAISSVTIIASEGINALGARPGGLGYGGPGFTKVTVRLTREQPLPEPFVARVKLAGQYTPDHLPASEAFAYGGIDFGQAFETATLFGDEAVAAAAELAYKLPDQSTSPWLGHSEAFVFGDWARVWNIHTIYALPTDEGASTGVGVRSKILDKVSLQLEAAHVLIQPRSVPKSQDWRFVAQLTGTF